MTNRYMRALVTILITINALIIIYVSGLVLLPVKVLTVKAPDKILNPGKTVVAGHILSYQVEYCKYTTVPVQLDRSLLSTNGTVYVLPPSKSNFPDGCHISVNRTTIVPEGIPEGSYRLGLTATYQVNPLKAVSVYHETEVFQVTAK